MITKWIFFESARKGLLKNVQDEISRPLESREIQKTKVERVLLDTLYILSLFRLLEVSFFLVSSCFPISPNSQRHA